MNYEKPMIEEIHFLESYSFLCNSIDDPGWDEDIPDDEDLNPIEGDPIWPDEH